MRRITTSAVIALLSIAPCVSPAPAFCADDIPDRPATLQPPARSSAETFYLQDSSRQGLRPPATSLRQRIDLPFGLNYSREAKSLVMPLDDKNEWGVGLNLNLNASPAVELSPPGLHLAPKRTPGLMLLKQF